MKVFVTGSSGRLGTHIIPHLLAGGHTITGLVRSEKSAETIKALGSGVTPLIGTLSDTSLLVDAAKSHDAVIHCAMDHGSGDMKAAQQQEFDTIKLFGDALANTDKTFIMSSAAGFVPAGGDETSTPISMNPRGKNETATIELKDRGVRSIAVRLAMNTHDAKKMHPFLGMLLNAEKTLGYIPYLGETRWSACHSDDAGLLYVLALEKAQAGTAVHAVEEFVKVRDIAEALARRTGLKAAEVDRSRLGEIGWLSILLQMNQDLKTEWTRETFGWEPKGQRLLDEIEAAPEAYFKEIQVIG